MATRTYRQGRRGAAAEETRRRIVEATYALHTEQGIAATSMKHIAARAEVSVGTVYHHFPTYDDAIRACGAHTLETVPQPTPAIFAGLRSPEERLARLAESVFDWYERLPALEHVRCDQDRLPVLRAFVETEEQNRLALMRAALNGLGLDDERIRTAAALLDLGAWQALGRAGATTREAAARITEILSCWLARTCTPATRP